MNDRRRFPVERFRARLQWSDLDEDYLRQLVGLGKIEDLAGAGFAAAPERMGDATTALLPEGARMDGALVAREPCVVCGLGMVPLVLAAYGEDAVFEPAVADGDRAEAGGRLGRIEGPAEGVLRAERVLLNFLQRLSGVATETARYVEALGITRTALLDTRKTIPGYRALEKYAFACGGGSNHRLGLFDRVMLKDNHRAVFEAGGAAGIRAAVRAARERDPEIPVEVEVDAMEQVDAAVAAGADIVLLDNFSREALALAVERVAGRAYTEASGGITRENLAALGTLGLDFISTGGPVHGSRWVDMGLDWRARPA